jgi:hypothetical protein
MPLPTKLEKQKEMVRRTSRMTGRMTGRKSANEPCSDYEISCITHDYNSFQWIAQWRRMLSESQSPEKIYQSPEFFRFLCKSQTSTSDQIRLFIVTRRSNGDVVGVVPVRMSNQVLDFKIGTYSFLTPRLRVVRILGSVPILAEEDGLTQSLINHLLCTFPDCVAVSMQAYPVELKDRLYKQQGLSFFTLNGWRKCHTIPLPENFDLYIAKFSAKKRYNLARQIRLLEKEVGIIAVQRIDQLAQVKLMIGSLNGVSDLDKMYFLSEREYEGLASHNLLLSYVLSSGSENIAVVLGSRYDKTWYVHRIYFSETYRHFSLGTIATHLAIKDIITNFTFMNVDFGYGEPNQRFASTHVLKTRAHVLLSRQGSWINLFLFAYVSYEKSHSLFVNQLKSTKRKLVFGAARVWRKILRVSKKFSG